MILTTYYRVHLAYCTSHIARGILQITYHRLHAADFMLHISLHITCYISIHARQGPEALARACSANGAHPRGAPKPDRLRGCAVRPLTPRRADPHNEPSKPPAHPPGGASKWLRPASRGGGAGAEAAEPGESTAPKGGYESGCTARSGRSRARRGGGRTVRRRAPERSRKRHAEQHIRPRALICGA